MDMYNPKIKVLAQEFPEVTPADYYRDMFPIGSFQTKSDSQNHQGNGLIRFRLAGKDHFYKRIVFDDFQNLENCVNGVGCFRNLDFAVLPGCSFIGKTSSTENASMCYAIIIDIDNVGQKEGVNIIYMIDVGILPRPTYIVASGNGVHLTYDLAYPVKMTPANRKLLINIKSALLDTAWTDKTSRKGSRDALQPLVQGYRMVGTPTKEINGKRYVVRAFRTGGKVFFDELDMWRQDIVVAATTDHLTLAEAAEKYPEWYKERIVQGRPAKHIHIGDLFYKNWYKTIAEHVEEGHRYKSIFVLCVAGQKCDIPPEDIERDAYALMDIFNSKPCAHPFTTENIASAMAEYHKRNYTRMSTITMEKIAGVTYPRGTTQRKKYPRKKHNTYDKRGRPDKAGFVKSYLADHPDVSNVSAVAKACGVSRDTARKYMH